MPNVDANIESTLQTFDHQTFCAITSFAQKTSSDSIVTSDIAIETVSFINSVKSKFIDAASLEAQKLSNLNGHIIQSYLNDLRASTTHSSEATESNLFIEDAENDVDTISLPEDAKSRGLQLSTDLQVDNFVSEEEDLYVPYSIATVPASAPADSAPRITIPTLALATAEVPPPPPIEDLHFESDEEDSLMGDEREEAYPEEVHIPPRARAIFEEFARNHITEWVIEGCKRSYEDVEDFSFIE